MNLAAHIDEQAKAVDTKPTEPQKHAGNYRKGHVKVHGLDISIENPRGSWREGGPPGKRWKSKLPHHYGYIRRTEGGDGDHVDVYLGPHLKSPHVFVVDQHELGSGKWDEHKAFIGFGSKIQAREAYHRAFSDGRGKDRIGHIETMTIDGFKHWLSHGDTTAPVKSRRPRYAEGGAVDDLSDADRAAMSPETFANPAVKNMIGSMATLPRRAIENSQHSLDTGTYDPGPTLEAATLPMGTGAIAGVPMRAGEAVLGAGPIRAYHGSPHDFDAFDLSKIGTGEGAQAYGHGLYFADSEAVAKSYRDALAPGQNLTFNGQPVSQMPTADAAVVTWMHNRGMTAQQVAEAADQHAAQELEKARLNGDFDTAHELGVAPEDLFGTNKRNIAAAARRIAESGPQEIGYGPKGRMYEVNINADPEHFLDWDKPLSEQSQHVRDAIAKADSSLSTKAPSLTDVKDPEIRSIVRRALKANEGSAQGLELAIDNDSALYNSAVNHAKRNKIDLDASDMRASDYVYQQAKPYIDALHAHQNMVGDSLAKVLGVKGADMMQAGPAAAKLREAGLPGIKYLDQGSRTTGEGSRNYVVFNDKLIDILKKYGITGAAATGMADEIMSQGKQHFASGGAVHMADSGAPSFDQTQPADSGPPPFEATQPAAPDVGGATAFGRGALQGATFNFADELRAIDEAGGASPTEPGTPLTSIKGAYKYFTGDPEAEQRYNAALGRERAANETAKAQHPYLHMAGELAGSIPAMAVLPGGEIGEAASLGTKMVQGAKVGAEYGGLSGLGEGTDTGDRAMKAAQGIVGGIVGGAAAPVVGSAANAVSERFIQPAIGAVRGAIDPAAEASRRLTSALQKDQELIAAGKAEGMSPQEWAAARSAGEPVTLADLGSSNTQALLRSSANTSPEGRAILEKALNDRFAGQTERVATEARGLVAGGANAAKTGDQLVAEYDRARAPAYKQAFQQGDKEIVSPAIERLMGSPTFENAMKAAVSSGKDRAITEGYGAFNPGVTVENGLIKFTKTKPNGVPQYPNLQYWDSVKKELDGVASVARRSGDMGKAEVAGNLAKTLRGELDQQVPSYANARGIASQYFGESNALEAGQKLAGKRVDPKQITDVMRQMKPDERELFREGYASDWANRVISNISDSRDITKAMFNSPNERARALAVFGQAGVDKMQARMTLETIMDGARKAMGNSTTARQLIEAGLAGGALEGYLSGWDPTKMAEGAAGAAGARKFLGSEMAAGARKLVGKVDTKTARLVAELLTSDDPTQLQKGLRMAQKNQRISDGLKNIANRVALAGQQQIAPPATRLVVHPMQGPMSVGAGQEQQQPEGVVH